MTEDETIKRINDKLDKLRRMLMTPEQKKIAQERAEDILGKDNPFADLVEGGTG